HVCACVHVCLCVCFLGNFVYLCVCVCVGVCVCVCVCVSCEWGGVWRRWGLCAVDKTRVTVRDGGWHLRSVEQLVNQSTYSSVNLFVCHTPCAFRDSVCVCVCVCVCLCVCATECHC